MDIPTTKIVQVKQDTREMGAPQGAIAQGQQRESQEWRWVKASSRPGAGRHWLYNGQAPSFTLHLPPI